MLGGPTQGFALGYHMWPFQGHIPASCHGRLDCDHAIKHGCVEHESGEGLANFMPLGGPPALPERCPLGPRLLAHIAAAAANQTRAGRSRSKSDAQAAASRAGTRWWVPNLKGRYTFGCMLADFALDYVAHLDYAKRIYPPRYDRS